MKKLTINSLLALALLVSNACNTSNKESTDTVETAEDANEMKQDSLPDDTADAQEESSGFLVNAASGGLMEVELGKLAQANGSNAEVKAFGKQMVSDHGKANEALKKLAAAKNITLPQAPGQDHQQHINELSALKGNEFDKKYIDMMVKDHQEDVDKFAAAAENNELDSEVKAFAQKTLPVLRNHLDMVKKIDEKMTD